MPLPDWKKVLVVDLGFLGDTVHSIPALRALASTGPEVDVMTTAVGAEVLAMVPEVKHVWEIPLGKPSPAPWRSLPTLLKIRRQNYDLALSFSGADRNLFCVAASGAKERIASAARYRWWLPGLCLTRSFSRPHQQQPLFQQRLEVVRALGWQDENPGWAWKSGVLAKSKATQTLPHPFVYLSVSAFGSAHKEWPLDFWAQAAQHAWKIRPELNFVVGCAPAAREQERARQLTQMAGKPDQLVFLNTSRSLADLAAALGQADVFAGLDSGVLHLAMAMGKPTVSVFRDYAGKIEWAPLGQNHRVLSRPCFCHKNQKDSCGEEPKCLAEISPQDVGEAILQLLSAETRKQ